MVGNLYRRQPGSFRKLFQTGGSVALGEVITIDT